MKMTRRNGMPVNDTWQPEAWREAQECMSYQQHWLADGVLRLRLAAAFARDIGVLRSLDPANSRN